MNYAGYQHSTGGAGRDWDSIRLCSKTQKKKATVFFLQGYQKNCTFVTVAGGPGLKAQHIIMTDPL